MNGEHMCPVCGRTKFPMMGSYENCFVCGWEDDGTQTRDPDFTGGANGMSLNMYKAKYESGWRPEWLKEYLKKER